MDLRAGTGVKAIEVKGDGVTATIKGKDGKETKEDFSHVIVAVGIVPNVENIGLEDVGVDRDRADPGADQVLGELGTVRRRLAAQ